MGALDKLLQYWCAACWHVEAAWCPSQAYVGPFLGRFTSGRTSTGIWHCEQVNIFLFRHCRNVRKSNAVHANLICISLNLAHRK